ncbi:MAG: dephospho-CoA kinase [Dorea sp.]|nr:dephospho-CoA kinase [Dorea sp.]
MKIIGITGGVGAGKSQVLDYLHMQYGACICKADEMGKKVQRKGTPCFQQIVEYFGEDIVKWNGELNREKLAQLVFSDEKKLQALNEMVHPAVQKEIDELIESERQKDTKLFILETAILIGSCYESMCDEIWYIYVTEENRKNRLMYARGYSAEKIENIFRAQMTKQEFLRSCDRVVDNNGLFEETTHQLDVILRELLED